MLVILIGIVLIQIKNEFATPVICGGMFYAGVLILSRNHVPEKLTVLERLERWPLPKTTISIILWCIFYFLVEINVI